MLSAMRCRMQIVGKLLKKGSQENAFVTLGYVGARILYEIAVYEFKIGRETYHCRSVASRAFFGPQWNLPMMFHVAGCVRAA
jgi:hypothetical protein